ncbi:MAG: nucleotide exchange factor GrpE [bacterium]|nr:nucleotide exchange factor GrpE [bacterium]
MSRKSSDDEMKIGERADGEDEEFKVADRRHWVEEDGEDEGKTTAEVEPAAPSILDEFRQRAESAEQKLQEYIEAFKAFKDEQENVRARLMRDVERKVELRFGEVVGELLVSVDDLDLALAHVADVPEAKALAEGVTMVRKRFLATLEKQGVQKLSPEGETFDPNEAEAIRVDPVDEADADGKVTETLQPGYKLGKLVVRPARVAVGQRRG